MRVCQATGAPRYRGWDGRHWWRDDRIAALAADGYCSGVPELPDVQGFRRVLDDHAVGRRIQRVEVLDAGVLHGISGRRLQQVLRGREFGRPWRHGKQLVILLHFGMTGSLHWASSPHRHDRIGFGFCGELRYRDLRKLHGLRFAPDHDAVGGQRYRLVLPLPASDRIVSRQLVGPGRSAGVRPAPRKVGKAGTRTSAYSKPTRHAGYLLVSDSAAVKNFTIGRKGPASRGFRGHHGVIG